MNTHWEDIFGIDDENWEERYRWELNQEHVVFKRGKEKTPESDYRQLLKICEQLYEKSVYLVTIVATDERYLEDGCFKLYYIFSHDANDHFLILEYPLREYAHTENEPLEQSFPKYFSGGRAYPSVHKVFAAATSCEREIFDLFDLSPFVIDPLGTISPSNSLVETSSNRFMLHSSYPPRLAPLETGKKVGEIQKEIEAYIPSMREARGKKHGETIFPVGPIHAGVIEAGHFSFHIVSEVIDDVDIQLGFKHKGIEKLFQTKISILDGWQLAEKISGDSSFSHSLAYCHAVEALAHIEPPVKAVWLRGLLLELERLYNHIGDTAALAHDVAFHLLSSEIAVLREFLVRFNGELTGHRLLRGVNRPGGVMLSLERREVFNCQTVNEIIREVSRKRFGSLQDLIEEFGELSELPLRTPGFRERMLNTGTLKKAEALRLGTTGLVARASGITQRDFRLNHPSGIYQLEPDLQKIVNLDTYLSEKEEPKRLRLAGDVYSRLQMRLHEVKTSFNVITSILETLEVVPGDELIHPDIEKAVGQAENFEFALGYVEGWRGDIFYWLMKGHFNKIFRCKVRDPSFLNWPALRSAVVPDNPDQPDTTGNILPDFPIINKSFNLSYSGHDL